MKLRLFYTRCNLISLLFNNYAPLCMCHITEADQGHVKNYSRLKSFKRFSKSFKRFSKQFKRFILGYNKFYFVEIKKNKRFYGNSKVNLEFLIIHAVKIISVFFKTALLRTFFLLLLTLIFLENLKLKTIFFLFFLIINLILISINIFLKPKKINLSIIKTVTQLDFYLIHFSIVIFDNSLFIFSFLQQSFLKIFFKYFSLSLCINKVFIF